MILLLLMAALAALSIVYFTLRTGISPMPSSPRARRAILECLPADVAGAVADLGCGWGSLVFPLARRFPRGEVTGYELSPVPLLFCKFRQWLWPLPNLRLRREDFHQVSLAGVDVVTCYLFTGAMRRLRPKLERELRPGAVVISHTFAIHGWTPRREIVLGDLFSTRIFLYTLPECLPPPRPDGISPADP